MRRNIPSKNAEVKRKCYMRDDKQCIPGKREPESPQEKFPLNLCLKGVGDGGGGRRTN